MSDSNIMNDEFYSKAFDKPYDCNWESVPGDKFSDFAEALTDSKIVGAEPIIDLNEVVGIALYLKKRDTKYVVSLRAPSELEEERELFIDICCE